MNEEKFKENIKNEEQSRVGIIILDDDKPSNLYTKLEDASKIFFINTKWQFMIQWSIIMITFKKKMKKKKNIMKRLLSYKINDKFKLYFLCL